MVAQLRQVFSDEDSQLIQRDLAQVPMVDGRRNAVDLGQDIKANRQADSSAESYRSMVKRVMAALQTNEACKKYALPRCLPPDFADLLEQL